MTDPRRALPAVHRLMDAALVARHGQARVAQAARAAIAAAREAGQGADLPTLLADVQARLRVGVTPVINATGVLLHTNLGRAPWAPRAIAAAAAAAGPAAVELDLATGGRGGRGAGIRDRLAALVGARDALVVNNCAAAVLLALTAVAHDRDVLVSRGELVEIGGGFRVPAVITASGARLREVGTTNRTHRRDFEAALDEGVAAVLSVHHSNFRQVGFVAAPTWADLATLGPPLVVDLGSGALFPGEEPSVTEALAAGAALVCFSGDKLLGGPQAGIIVGDPAWVERLRRHPLFRALRVDKTIDAALEGTLDAWLTGDALPVRDRAAASLDALRAEAAGWQAALAGVVACRVLEVEGQTGGGSLPGLPRPSVALALDVADPDALVRGLRAGEPAVIARVQHGAVLLDARTVGDQGPALVAAVYAACMARPVAPA
ncbi:MAG: L-seryl-tRNA(Sec) selenium transferase [Myxococcales bacterium]|nr:L-seryl-tRNA(Sec) selenium transferase [Myxococcales bacterium]